MYGINHDTFHGNSPSKIGGGLGAANAYIYTINQTNTRRTTGFKGSNRGQGLLAGFRGRRMLTSNDKARDLLSLSSR